MGGWNHYYNSNAWVMQALQPIFIALVLSAGLIGEANANQYEKIYILSKNVNRSEFVSAKILASLSWALIGWFIAIIMLVVVDLDMRFSRAHDYSIFSPQASEEGIILNTLLWTLTSAIICTLGKYFLRGGITIFICTGIVLVFTIIFSVFVFPDGGDSKMAMLLYTTILPCVLCFILIVFLGTWFGVKFNRHVVGP
ncbi:MAG: hypothetical protein LBM72_01050 [Mycoplasmataceae bacterium]|nr:hypothetical protein [Mycoplasmataceae bacterium]